MQFLQTCKVIFPKHPALTSIVSVDSLKHPKALQMFLFMDLDIEWLLILANHNL
jgi:hypothetical protein